MLTQEKNEMYNCIHSVDVEKFSNKSKAFHRMDKQRKMIFFVTSMFSFLDFKK